jgi:hypothetical protein
MARRRIARALYGYEWRKHAKSPLRWFRDDLYPDDYILRVDTYLRNHPWTAEVLDGKLLPERHNRSYGRGAPRTRIPEPETEDYVTVIRNRLRWFEASTPLLESILEDSDDQQGLTGVSDYHKISVIKELYRSLGIDHRPPLTSEQHCAFLTAALLLGTGAPFTPNRWITQRLLERPADVGPAVDEFRARLERHQWIVEMLGGVTEHVVNYSDELIQRLVEVRNSNMHVFRDIVGVVESQAGEAEVSEKIYFTQQTGLDLSEIDGFINGLHDYEELPSYDDYSKAPEDVRYQCAALIKVGVTLFDSQSDPALSDVTMQRHEVITDKRLVSLILAHPERADMITTAIHERKITDYESIAGMTTGLLSEGAL